MSNPHMNADKAYEADKQQKLDLITKAYQRGRTDTLKAVREATEQELRFWAYESTDGIQACNNLLQALTKMEKQDE